MAVVLLVAAAVAVAVSVVYLGASTKESAAEGVTSLIRERLGRSWVSQGFKIAIVSWQIVSQASGGSIPSRRISRHDTKYQMKLWATCSICLSPTFASVEVVGSPVYLPPYYYRLTFPAKRMHAPEGFI